MLKPIVNDPLAEARKQRAKNVFTHLAAGLLWIIGIWGTILIVFWRLGQ